MSKLLGLIDNLKRVRFARIAVTIAASFVLLLGTACSPSSPSVSGTGSYEQGKANPTELYRPIQPNEGGMNTYSDTDPRRNTKGLGSKVKARVDEAESNIDKVQNPREFAEDYRKGTPLGQRVRNITDSVGETAKDVTEDVTKGTERGISNLKRNTQQAKQGLQETLDDASQNAQDLGKDTSRSAQRSFDRVKSNADDARRDLSENLSSMGERSDKFAARSNSSSEPLQSKRQGTPDLNAKDLAERAKDTFGTATRNVGQ
jgi:hypothetical protein